MGLWLRGWLTVGTAVALHPPARRGRREPAAGLSWGAPGRLRLRLDGRPDRRLAMPPTITLEQMTGFSLFMLKAVLSGRGDEIVDLARVNLFRS